MPPSPAVEPFAASPRRLVGRLAAMMFLHYWSFGVWAVTVGAYIAANTESEGGAIFSAGFLGYASAAGAVGSMASPALVGLLSDRVLSAQFLLALAHLGCGASAWGMLATQGQWPFLACLLAYFHCFFPALALTNQIAMRHLASADLEFPRVRSAGTLGWIAAGVAVGWAWPAATGRIIEATSVPLALGAVSSFAMAAYALTLPATPPESAAGPTRYTGLGLAGALVGNPRLLAFLAVSVFAGMATVAYNSYANLYLNRRQFPHPAALMTLGQVSDLVCLAVAPWLIAKLELRRLFAAGIFAWAARYALLAFASWWDVRWPVYAAILIHGPCFVFVFVGGAMLVDRLADPSQRGLAQGLFAVASSGIGNLAGALAMGLAQAQFLTPADQTPPPYAWAPFWLVPTLTSGLTVVLVAFTFARWAADGEAGERFA